MTVTVSLIDANCTAMDIRKWRSRGARAARTLAVIVLSGLALLTLLVVNNKASKSVYAVLDEMDTSGPEWAASDRKTRERQARTVVTPFDFDNSRAKVSCAAGLDGSQPKLEVDLNCEFIFAESDPLVRGFRTGNITVPDIIDEYFGKSDIVDGGYSYSSLDSEVTEGRDNADVRFVLRARFAYPWMVTSPPALWLQHPDLTVISPVVARDRHAARAIDWTVRLNSLKLAGFNGGVVVHERDKTSAQVSATSATGMLVTFRTTKDTNPDIRMSIESGAYKDPVLTLMTDVPFTILTGVTPFILFALLVRKRNDFFRRRVRPFVLAYLIGAVFVGVLIFLSSSSPLDTSSLLDGWLWSAAAAVLIAVMRMSKNQPPMTPRCAALLWGLSALVLLSGGFLVMAAGLGVAQLASQAVLLVACTALAVGLTGSGNLLAIGLPLGVMSLAAAMILPVAAFTYWLLNPLALSSTFSILVQLLCGVPLLMLTRHIMLDIAPQARWLRLFLSVVAALSIVSIPSLVGDPQSITTTIDPRGFEDPVTKWTDIGRFLLLLLLLSGLREEMRRDIPYKNGSAVLVLATSTAIVVSSLDSSKYNWFVIAAQALLPFLMIFLVKHRLSGRADDLGTVGSIVHSRLVRAEVKRRRISRAITSMLRSLHTKATDQDVKSSDVIKEINALESMEGPRRSRPDYITLTNAALGSNGGVSRTDNLKAGGLLGLLLSIPVAAFEIIVLARTGQPLNFALHDTITLLGISLVLFKGAVYGALAGYYYPLIRGANSVQKFASMLLVVAITELVAFASSLSESNATLLTGAIRLGTLVVFFLAMGLVWERRLAILANIPWIRLRDFRSVRALGTPVTTVIVAGATVLITALASAAVAPIIQPPPAPSENRSQPDQTTTPTGPPPASGATSPR